VDLAADTLGVFLLLVPGFVSSVILNAIVVRKPRPNLHDIIEALVFSFVIYVCLVPFFGIDPVALEMTADGNRTFYRPVVDAWFLVAMLGLGVLLAVGVGASIINDFHMALLRRLRITARTARDNTWLDIFIDQRRYVVVTLTDGRRLFGWPQYYSNDSEEGLIYLFEPAWIDDDGQYVDLGVHGILLTNKDQIETVAFTQLSAEAARPARQEG